MNPKVLEHYRNFNKMAKDLEGMTLHDMFDLISMYYPNDIIINTFIDRIKEELKFRNIDWH